ncbi:nuclear transport factor 2 family protein [Congregibacter litoralis]|uniref:DUF4440 domain-containing protein n=1 Tax=Congregibacter litoralis KT71 TaxID=314285 RepID=A4A717_9GAMM|nr:nuclear transport factor 2 family protein [Congregibacter litoralis]EAQ98086.1 hypothetical protein KT71_02527 [Congregibacter litoralis KT71]
MTQQLRSWSVVIASALFSTPIALAQGLGSPQAMDAETFLAMDREVIEAFLAGDADTYAAAMSDDFFLFQKGFRATRDYAVAMVSEIDCDVREPLRLTAPHLLAVGNDAYVLSYRMDIGATCASGNVAITLPTPVRASTLWVKKGNDWEIAYHGENAIETPKPTPENLPDTRSDVSEAVAAQNVTNSDDGSGDGFDDGFDVNKFPPEGSLLGTLMARESAVWETWRAHDADALVKLTADDIAFVNIYGDFFPDKKTTIDNWTGPFCNVDRISLGQATATQFLPAVAVLTLTGIVSGSCGDQAFDDLPVYATTVYTLKAGEWRWAFGFNAP